LVGDTDAFRIIGHTEGVPFITFALSERVPASVRGDVRRCLLAMRGARVPEDLCTTGLVVPRAWDPQEVQQT
jgi:hypothetical protein